MSSHAYLAEKSKTQDLLDMKKLKTEIGIDIRKELNEGTKKNEEDFIFNHSMTKRT